MPIRRWRTCPRCGQTMPGGRLLPVRFGPHWHPYGGTLRRCPVCSYEGYTREFAIQKEVG